MTLPWDKGEGIRIGEISDRPSLETRLPGKPNQNKLIASAALIYPLTLIFAIPYNVYISNFFRPCSSSWALCAC